MFVQKNIKIPKPMWEACKELIDRGVYVSDSELIRTAIRLLLEKEGLKVGNSNEHA